MSNDLVALLPCPFCGGNAKIKEFAGYERAYFVECDSCQAGSKLVYALMDEATDELVSAWNRRAALTAAQQPEAEHVRVPVEPTDEFIEGVARRLCIHAYPDRSLDEVLAPNVKLWMRMKSEAMQAIDAVIATAKEAK